MKKSLKTSGPGLEHMHFFSVYFGGKQCVLKYVGGDCGDNYANAIANASPLFSVDIPSDCEKPVGGVSNLQASVLTMIGATALLLLGRF